MVVAGVHVSIAGSLDQAAGRAVERGCDCFQIFTKNPRGWAAKVITDQDAAAFRNAVSASSLQPIFAHMPYLPNLASEKPEMYRKSVDALVLELQRCSLLGIPYLVTHLGHAGDDTGLGRDRVVSAVLQAFDQDSSDVTLLLENTAGERNSVGSRLEEIATVLNGIGDKSRTGICFDTCHAFAAGYDLRTPDAVSSVAEQIDTLFGLSRIALIHLNDAKGACGSGLDRHEHIGCGSIGEHGIAAVLQHPGFNKIPVICETPVDDRRGDAENITVVRRLEAEVFQNV
nr:deoxyribonuclease IV [uncultured Methanospirillum sp.]